MRCVFVGTGGFLARFDTTTHAAFWAADSQTHGYDPALLVELDLARTPSAAVAGTVGWDRVELDDPVAGALLYVHHALVKPQLPLGADPCEYMTAVYWSTVDDPRAGRRYTGHWAQILDEAGSLARVAVWPHAAPGDPAVHRLDFADPADVDAGPASLTEIGPGPRPKAGPLFLATGTVEGSAG